MKFGIVDSSLNKILSPYEVRLFSDVDYSISLINQTEKRVKLLQISFPTGGL